MVCSERGTSGMDKLSSYKFPQMSSLSIMCLGLAPAHQLHQAFTDINGKEICSARLKHCPIREDRKQSQACQPACVNDMCLLDRIML